MSTDDTEKHERIESRIDRSAQPQSLKTEALVTSTDVNEAEQTRTHRFESMRNTRALTPDMTQEEARRLETEIDAFGIDFGEEILTSDGIQLKKTRRPSKSESEILATPTHEVAHRNEEYDGGTFKIPTPESQRSPDRTGTPERFGDFVELQAEQTEGAQAASTNYPLEQAIWKALHPEDSNLTDEQITLFRSVIGETAKKFAQDTKQSVEDFVEKQKREIALALVTTLFQGAILGEGIKETAIGAGSSLSPVAAITTGALLRFIVQQAKAPPGIPEAPIMPDSPLPDTGSVKKITDDVSKRFKQLQKTAEEFQKDPVGSVEDFFLRAEAWNVIENNIVSNPTTLLEQQHTIRLIEQMESMNPIDLVEAGRNTRFVFPEQLTTLDMTAFPADIQNVLSAPILGSGFTNEFSNGFTVFSEVANKEYIFVPANALEPLTERLIPNAGVAGVVLHEMGHILHDKYNWMRDREVRLHLETKQQRLIRDISEVDQLRRNGVQLSPAQDALLDLRRYTRVDDSIREPQRSRLLGIAKEEILCDLFAHSNGNSGLPTEQERLLLEYFRPVEEHLEANNWNRPSGKIDWLRNLMGDQK